MNEKTVKVGLMCHIYHEEVLILLYEMCRDAGKIITLFLSEQVYSNTFGYWEGRQGKFLLQVIPGSGLHFYSEVFQLAHDIDELIGTEVPGCLGFSRENFEGKLSWVLHELVFDFGLEWIPPWRRGKVERKKRHAEYVKYGDGYYVLSTEMREFSVKFTRKDVYVIPITALPTNRSDKSDKTFTVVISGRVTECKDYELAINIILAIRQQGLGIRLILLGRLGADQYALRIKKVIEEANQKYPELVTYYENYIEDAAFGKIISRCDCLLAPLNRNNSFLNRCFSKKNLIDYHISNHITGSYEESIRYQKPILYPVWFYNPCPVPEGTMLYSNNGELREILVNLIGCGYREA